MSEDGMADISLIRKDDDNDGFIRTEIRERRIHGRDQSREYGVCRGCEERKYGVCGSSEGRESHDRQDGDGKSEDGPHDTHSCTESCVERTELCEDRCIDGIEAARKAAGGTWTSSHKGNSGARHSGQGSLQDADNDRPVSIRTKILPVNREFFVLSKRPERFRTR